MPHPLNVFFDKVFIISIKRNQQRLETFIETNSDLDVEIILGIDGKELYPTIEYVSNFPMSFFEENQLSPDRCKCLNKSQLGCAMSNLLVQKEIVKRNLKNALILEDDAFLLSKELLVFQRAVLELPPGWELFYLGFNAPSKWAAHPLTRILLKIKYFIKPALISGMSSANLQKRFFLSSFSKHINLPGIYVGSHAYALSNDGAKKIIFIDTPLQYGFDTTLMHASYHKLINSYSLKKPLFIPNPIFETSLIN